MFKKILFLFTFLLSFKLNAEIIELLEISGNNRISNETVKVYGNIELGKDYSNQDLNEILKNLYSTEFFENIEISVKQNTMYILLKEYPVINDLIFEGETSSQIKKFITDKISLKSKASFIESKLNNDLILIKKVYASLGYNFIDIETRVANFSDNRINLFYKINKGKKTLIKQIDFIGDKKLKDTRLRDIIVSEENKFWKFLSKNVYFTEANIDLDKRLLLNYYKSLGYYDVQVLSNSAEIARTNIEDYVNLTFTINAGKRYKIKKITTNLDKILEKKVFASLEDSFKSLVNKYYSPFKIKKLLDEVDLLILQNNFQFIEHSVNEILENDYIEIVININEIKKKELVERVNIKGNTVTNESVVRGELLLDEGDPFNGLKLDQSISRIKARNIFGDVKFDVKEGSKQDQKVINIIVEEKPTGEISAGAGFGTNGGSFAFNIKENNWLGEGINISTNLDLSKETFTGGISINDPNFRSTGNSLSYFVENTKNKKPDSGFENSISSIGVGTKFEQYKDIFISPNVSFSYDNLRVSDTASDSLKKQKGKFSDLALGYGISLDKRDRAYGPTEGYLTSFSQNIPIYADAPYLKNTFAFSKYQTLTPNIIGALKFFGSSINGLEGKDVRLSKRLDITNSRLRGFERGKIGPKDGSDYVGGNYALATNFEINLPNLLPESTKTDIGFFLDVGNLWHVDYGTNIDDSNKIRSSIGANTSWQSPVGPMSFILSQNLSKADTDVTESFNFRLGTTF